MYRLFISALACFSASCFASYQVMIDNTTRQKLDTLLAINTMEQNETPGVHLARLSDAFTGTPYQANTLIGSPSHPEKLVVNFNEVDCFTFLDYLHALSHSTNEEDFLKNLADTRYKDGDVNYFNRKHFFSDWFSVAPQNAEDITAQLSPYAITTQKHLNHKEDGSHFLPDVPVVTRNITWIPTSHVDEQVMQHIQEGDNIGIYTNLDGLDVTHTGIAVRKSGQLYFRNASSKSSKMKVVDTPLLSYLHDYPGIVVLRPL